jgi:protein TonB
MVAETGELNRCVVASETPEGFGFGASAIAMAGLFRMQSVDQDGQPIRGGVVRIPINFRTSSNLARRF